MQVPGEVLKRLAENLLVMYLLERQLCCCTEQVAGKDIGIFYIDNRIFMAPQEEFLWVVHEILVKRVCLGNEDCKGFVPAPPALPACWRVDIMVPG